MTTSEQRSSSGLARMVAELTRRRPTLLTLAELARLAGMVGLRTPPKMLACRLRAAGCLKPTGQRGVYQFVPTTSCNAREHDPFLDLRAVSLVAPQPAFIAFRSALWLQGITGQAPDCHEVAVPVGAMLREAVRQRLRVVRFSGRLPATRISRLPVQQPATILVHLATTPWNVRGWSTVAESLPELAARCTIRQLEYELDRRPTTVRPRLAYLLSGVAPDRASELQPARPHTVIWFGQPQANYRLDNRFNVADSLLPFDPHTLAAR